MVSGAVIIGKPIGPGMIRPFSKVDFSDLVEKCGLGLCYNNPIEVAYPSSLDEVDGYGYQEGILLNVYNVVGQYVDEFREEVKDRVIYAAKMAERRWDAYLHGKKLKPWESDLDSQKVCSQRIGGKNGGVIWEPFMEILDVYSDREAKDRYIEIAVDLSFKTKDARIKRYKSVQFEKFTNDINMISA